MTAAQASAANDRIAFPGAMGWAASTPGGRGGKILKVTTLATAGPGSLAEALAQPYPRIIVFEVGGVIDLGAQTLRVTEPFLSIAGQTAPFPGITLIRGGLDVATHDVVIRHIRVRPGEAGAAKRAGVDFDGISTVAGRDVIIDHCSLSWATDENLSASGPRFVEGGKTLEDFRRGTSQRITFSHNLIAEGLAHATHAKGEHSKGSLIHDHVGDILIIGNLYAHNFERSPMFKGDVRGQIINNLIYNPGQRAVHYNLIPEEWAGHAYVPAEMTLVGNVMRAGPSTPPDVALLMIGGSADLMLFARDNLAVDRMGRALPQTGRYTTSAAHIIELPMHDLAFGVTALPSVDVQDWVIANAGARPWDRDDVDRRIVSDVVEGRGAIIDSETDVGGYPQYEETRQDFVAADWDLATMEPRKPLPTRAPPK
ncbi:MAG: polysaccharide lyase family 1 protein [Lysobacterales bacterium]